MQLRRTLGPLGAMALATAACASATTIPPTTEPHAISGSWMIEKTRPRSPWLLGVSCTSASRCWIVGGPEGGSAPGRGAVFATTDGGGGWVDQTLPPLVGGLFDVSCIQSDCWAVGENPTNKQAAIAATANGGKSWQTQTVPSGIRELLGVACVSASHCWAVGDSDVLAS